MATSSSSSSTQSLTDGALARRIQEDEYNKTPPPPYQSYPPPPHPHRAVLYPRSPGAVSCPRRPDLGPRASISGCGHDDVISDHILARHMQEELDAESAKELERKGGGRGYHAAAGGGTSYLHPDLRGNNASSCNSYHGNKGGTSQHSYSEPDVSHPPLIQPHDIDMSYEVLSELEDVSLGVDRTTLSKLTSTYYYRGQESDTKSCSVCLSPFSCGHLLRTLPCLHVFHRDCVDQWTEEHNQCPVCKEEIKDHPHV